MLRALPLAALAALAGCDLPTRLPQGWDTEFEFEVRSVRMAVAELLPPSVGVTPDSTAFLLDLAPAVASVSLGELCPPCAVAQGLEIPKPAFQISFSGSIPLGEDLTRVSLSGGRIRVNVENRMNFDPLRPGGGAGGSVTIRLRSGEVALAAPLVVTGTQTALPPGGSITREIALNAATLTGPIVVEVTVDSPAGDPVVVDMAARLEASATPLGITATSVHAVADGRQFTSPSTEIDLRELNDVVRDRLRRGELRVLVHNPAEVAGPVTLRFSAPGVNVVRPLELAPGTRTYVIPLTVEELKLIFSRPVDVSVSGAVWGPESGVLLTPRQVLVAEPRFYIVVGIDE